MARHLHPQGGGDPSQGPVRELANEPPSPGAGNDFPDVPEGNRPSEDPTVEDDDGDTDDGDTDDTEGDDTED